MNEIAMQSSLKRKEHATAELERVALQFPLRNEADYRQAVALVNTLAEQMLEDGDHPLRCAMSVVVEQVRQYGELHYRLPEPAPYELVEFMMEQRQIGFADMASVSDAETLAAVVAGTLPIDAAMALRLGEFFSLPAELFFPSAPPRPVAAQP